MMFSATNMLRIQFMQRVLNGEANCGRQIVTISSTDGKIIGYARPQYPTVSLYKGVEMCRNATFAFLVSTYFIILLKQRKGSDASAESGSEMEDVTSPIASRNLITNPNLTLVHEEASV
jgi:hypothetical protein